MKTSAPHRTAGRSKACGTVGGRQYRIRGKRQPTANAHAAEPPGRAATKSLQVAASRSLLLVTNLYDWSSQITNRHELPLVKTF